MKNGSDHLREHRAAGAVAGEQRGRFALSAVRGTAVHVFRSLRQRTEVERRVLLREPEGAEVLRGGFVRSNLDFGDLPVRRSQVQRQHKQSMTSKRCREQNVHEVTFPVTSLKLLSCVENEV